jgi:predicted permease
MTPDDARAVAQRAFGNVTRAKERFYETSRWMWLEQLRQDLRYAARGMRQSPAFVVTTVLTLAVGLGLLTIAFTIFNAYVLRPFAVRDAGSLHQIVWHAPNAGGQGFRWRDYDELAVRTDLFTDVVGEYTRFVSSRGRPLMAAFVSSNYFAALGPRMALGRGLGRIDADGPGAVVLSHQAWTRLFQGDPAAVGRELELNGRLFTIVGVLSPAFVGLGDFPRDLFLPRTVTWTRSGTIDEARNAELREIEIIVRLRRDVGAARAESALTPFMNRIIEGHQQVRAEVRPQSSPNPMSVGTLAVVAPVFAAFALVLVTACANVSNVMLARAIARHREIAVRLSIGASRGRLIRQLLTEGLLIAALAGGIGLAFAAWGLRAATTVLFSTLPPSVAPILRLTPMPFDARVFVFALVVSGAALLLFALLPSLQASRVSLIDALRGQGGAARRGSRLRNALVIAQVAVALLLVVTAATLARNGAAVGALDLGFATDGVISVNVRGEQDDVARPLAEALEADPRIASVAITSGNPLFTQGRLLAAAPAGGSLVVPTPTTFVSPEFFPLLQIPIARGRAFRSDEARAAARIAIVSAATAEAFWPGEDPIGKTIRIERAQGRPVDELPDYPEVTVVGTVRDIVAGIMVTGRDAGHIYLPITRTDAHATAILLRARSGERLDAEALHGIFSRVVADPQLFEVVPLGEIRDLQMYPLIAASWVGSLLGGVALALSISGLYGVLIYAFSQRRKEIGIRMALGATTRAVLALVVRQTSRLAAIGILIGAVAALAVLETLSAAIHFAAVSLLDVRPFVAGIAVVTAATIVAAYGPARRATHVDPAQMLRTDV